MSPVAGIAPGPNSALELVDLQRVTGRELDPLLLEETVEWERELDWDFAQSADLVRRYTDQRALAGAALLDRGEVAGYAYAVLDGQRALIGDLYVRSLWRTNDAQLRLLRTIFDMLIGVPAVRRLESQLLMLEPAIGEALSKDRKVEISERLLLSSALADVQPGQGGGRFRIEPWSDHHEEQAAAVIALAYSGHVDSRIDEQYSSIAGARRFLNNIVRYPGCGTFFKPASLVAFDRQTGHIAGLVLVSFVGPVTGHITQLCVTPATRGLGLGGQLLGRAMESLRRSGAKRVSLTVTAANAGAVQLYRRTGFRELRRFLAYTWDRT